MSKRSMYFNTAYEARLYFPDGVPSNVIAIVGDGSQVLVSSDNTANQQYFSADLTNDDIVSEMVQTSYTEGQTAGYDMGYAAGVASVPTPTGNINITTTSQYDVTSYATAQVVDANLISGNIVSGTTILGVTGSYEGGITPSGNINITTTSQYDVTAYATAQVVDANLVAGNIVSGTTILGVTGTYTGSGGTSGIAEEDYYGLASRYAKQEFVNGVKNTVAQAVDQETADAIQPLNDIIYTSYNDPNMLDVINFSMFNACHNADGPIFGYGQMIVQKINGDEIIDITSYGNSDWNSGPEQTLKFSWVGTVAGGSSIGVGLANGGTTEREPEYGDELPEGLEWVVDGGDPYIDSPNEEWSLDEGVGGWVNNTTGDVWYETIYEQDIAPVFFKTNDNFYNHWLQVPGASQDTYTVEIGWSGYGDVQFEGVDGFIFDCSAGGL